MKNNSNIIDSKEAAKIIGVSLPTLWRRVNIGLIKKLDTGGIRQVLFDRDYIIGLQDDFEKFKSERIGSKKVLRMAGWACKASIYREIKFGLIPEPEFHALSPLAFWKKKDIEKFLSNRKS